MILASFALMLTMSSTQADFASQAVAMRTKGLQELGAFSILEPLVTDIGPRPAGSINAAKAVEWGKRTMERIGLDNVHLVACTVPHWIRGTENVYLVQPGLRPDKLSACALGMSVATAPEGLEAEVIEVKSVKECEALGGAAKGKIVFFNGSFDLSLLNTFAQYGGAVGQRVNGASAAAKLGAVAVLVRSMTTDPDDVPHTGVVEYDPTSPSIPAAALSIVAANRLSAAIKAGPLKIQMKLSCRMGEDEPSADVVGEITGSEKPGEIIVIGGHLDSWDKGRGAHDDGAGIAHVLEAVRLMKEMGWKPKRTIRVVLFMDEEKSGRGAAAYAAASVAEKTIAALETDSGGFAPRGFSTSVAAGKLDAWLPVLGEFGIEKFRYGGGGGADIGELGKQGAALFGLIPESQRYFDYHHSDKDTLDKVNPRELELGAMSVGMLAWMISETGL
ncbi:M28 family peptidase [soil metagenome]